MLSLIKKIAGLLDSHERSSAIVILGMVVLSGFMEMVGVASVIPFMSLLADPSVVTSHQIWATVFSFSGLKTPNAFLFAMGWTVLIAIVMSNGLRACTHYAIVRFTTMRSFSLSDRLIGSYLQRPYEWFLQRNSAELGKTILAEVDQVVRQAILPLANLIAGVVSVTFIFGVLLWADPLLAFSSAFVLGAAYALIYLFLRPTVGRLGKERVFHNRQRYQIVAETFGGIKQIKLAGLEALCRQRFRAPAMAYARADAVSLLASGMPKFLLEILAFGGMLAICLYLMLTRGELSQVMPVLALYAFAGYRLLPVLQQVYSAASQLRFAAAAVDKLHVETAGGIGSAPCRVSAKVMPSTDDHCSVSNSLIQLRNVTYRYPGARANSLTNVTLSIPEKRLVGFVGPTGSGKTTVIDIILGLLVPTNGDVRICHEVITAESIRTWQNRIGYVPQHIFLSDDTVAGNIAFGVPKEQISLDAVREAARIANLDSFVMNELSDGYSTRIGERGLRLSGGQRQRIAIARALYHSPDVIVMDEATSALDNLTERAVIEAIEKVSCKSTVIVVAHRLTTVKMCESLFLLEGGRVTAEGSYEQLLAVSEPFRKLASVG